MKNIVILGGGLAGYYVAKGLEKGLRPGEAAVTLVDMRDACVYQPFLAEVVSGAIEPRHILTPLKRHLPKTNVVQAKVVSVDAQAKAVIVTSCAEDAPRVTWSIPFDELVVTLGAVTKTFPTPGIAQNAIGLKAVEEAVNIRDRLVANIRTAAALPADAPERKRLLTFVVVGGGFSGVECFAEACDLARIMRKRYPQIKAEDLEFHLIEAADRIMPELPPSKSSWVIERVGRRCGQVHLETCVTDATDGVVRTSTGAVYDAGVLVWTAGVTANPVLRASDLPLEPRGRLTCGADLRVRTSCEQGAPVLEGVWGCGDATCVPDLTGAGLPDGSCAPTAQHAVRQARVLARNLLAHLRGESLTDYRHQNAGMVAGLGTGAGIFSNGAKTLVIKGWPAWFMHRGYHGLALPGWERKLRVFGDWTAGLVIKRDCTSTGKVGHPRAFFEEFALRPPEPSQK